MFLSYYSLSKILVKYNINSDRIISIPQFASDKLYACQSFLLINFELTNSIYRLYPIEENSLKFKLYIDDILYRIKNMGLVVDSNKAICYEYILIILHIAISLLKDLLILSQMTVTGTESSGCLNYTIKKIIDSLFEEIICITKGKQNQL